MMGWQNEYYGRKRGAWYWKMTATQWNKWRCDEFELGNLWDGMRMLKAAGWHCRMEHYEKTGSAWLLAWPPGEKLHRMSLSELDRRFYADLRRIVTPRWFELYGSGLQFE
jgi:hypothetical protein